MALWPLLINVTLWSGGSEKFQDKRTFFYNEVKKLRTHSNRGEVTLLIARDSVLESVSEPLLLVQISSNNLFTCKGYGSYSLVSQFRTGTRNVTLNSKERKACLCVLANNMIVPSWQVSTGVE